MFKGRPQSFHMTGYSPDLSNVACLVAVIGIDSVFGIENRRVCPTFNNKYSGQTFFSPSQGMVHDEVVAGIVNLKLHHCRSTGGNQRCLNVGKRRAGKRGLIIDSIEYLTDHVKTGGEIGAAHTKKYAHSFTHISFKFMGFC